MKEPERKETLAAKWKGWPRIAKFSTGAVTVIGLVAALITILQFVVPRHDLGITFTSPSPDAVMPVPCILTVTGSGSPPTGQVLVLSSQQQGTSSNIDSTMYFAVAAITADAWRAVSQVGKGSTPTGTSFTLTTWLVNADWVNYLRQVTLRQPLWWGTFGVPPGARKIQSVTVTRAAGKCS